MAPPVRPIQDRIRERVDIDERGCWLWRGPVFKDGYGAIGIRRTGTQRAHRVSYDAFVGPIPTGLWVLHRCDVPRCVNPEHLFLGTPSDNTQDCFAKGRRHIRRGEEHHGAKHTERFVWGVRQLRKIGLSITEIARMFGMDYFRIYQLCSGRSWRHIDHAGMFAQYSREWGPRNAAAN